MNYFRTPTGGILRIHEKNRPLEERFWEKVSRGKKDECWEWWGATNIRPPYGKFSHKDAPCRMMLAHRMSWILAHGKIPKGKWVLHKCNNPLCVNPNHLYVGTRKDNTLDCCLDKGTNRRLTPEQVRAIRKDHRSSRIIGPEYGVAPSTIRTIWQGKDWRWLK